MSPTAALAEPLPFPRHSWTAIWQLCWPLVLTMTASAAVGLLDTWIAGQFSPQSQAVVGLSMQLVLLINATTTAVAIGAQAIVARFVGGGDWLQAGRAARQALLLGGGLSLLVLPLVWVGAPWLFQVMGTQAAVQEVGTQYLRHLALGLLPMDLLIVAHAILRARGHTRAVLAATLVETGLWSLVSLTFGWIWGGGLAALATAFIVGKLGGLAAAWHFVRQTRLYRVSAAPWRLDLGWSRRILRVGLPAGAQVILRNLGMMAYFWILGRLNHPTEVVAAFSIGFRVESLAFLPVFALNIAASTLVGQSLGAAHPDQAEAGTWRIVGAGIAVMTAFGLAFFFGAEPLAALFTSDPLVQGYAVDYLRIMAVSEPFLALAMVLNGALQGAGDARAPLVAVMIFQIALRVPLAYLAAITLGWGAVGAWWAMTASMVAQAVGMLWYFRLGRWRHQSV
ncbi:MAG: MATE family efflux transporter [Candidatus Sericytochromatia bacterium]|nr:MATE family efflux transporter [Candidatus Sericytochromatia bacterium]